MEAEMKQMKEEKDTLQKQLDEVQNINNSQLQRIFELGTQMKGYQTNFAQMQQQKAMNSQWNGMSDEEKEQYTKQYQQQVAQYYKQQEQQHDHLLPTDNTHLAPAGSSEYESSSMALTDDASGVSHQTEHSHSDNDKDTLRCVKTLHGKNTMMDIQEYISDELKQEMDGKKDVVVLVEEDEEEEED